jgi:hypothetical protein
MRRISRVARQERGSIVFSFHHAVQETLPAEAEPEELLGGKAGELLAVRELDPSKWIVSVYCERADDGFVMPRIAR